MNVIRFDKGRNVFHFMDSIRIFSLMSFPEDGQEEECMMCTAHLVMLMYLRYQEKIHSKNEKYSTEALIILHETADKLMEGFFTYYGYDAFKFSLMNQSKSMKELLDKNWRDGLIAGDILRDIIRIDRYYQQEHSTETAGIGKAMHLAKVLLKDTIDAEGKKLPVSHSNLENNIWRKYKAVAHYFAAYDDMRILSINNQLSESWRDSELLFVTPHFLRKFFSIAAFYKNFAINHISETNNTPVVKKEIMWDVPEHLEIIAEDPQCIMPLCSIEVREIKYGYQAINGHKTKSVDQ